jgi:hypothetical protein
MKGDQRQRRYFIDERLQAIQSPFSFTEARYTLQAKETIPTLRGFTQTVTLHDLALSHVSLSTSEPSAIAAGLS